MVTKITSENVELIKNPLLKKEALRYVEIYDKFIDNVESMGVKVSKTFDRTQSEALKEKLKSLGATIANDGKSVFINNISPACIDCRKGIGSSTYILTLDCNRDCFFCTNKNQIDYDTSKNKVNDVYAEFKHDLNIYKKMTSVALTGGEPLLYPDKCIEFIKKVKKVSKNTQVRIYTNGDLITEDILKNLQSVSLDEMRFGLKPDKNGDISPAIMKNIEMAVKYIPRTMVEMPVFPNTLEKMKSLMVNLDKMGVYSVNILEFLYPFVHSEEYTNQGHIIAYRPYGVLFDYTYAGGLPISNSETDCLNLLLFCAESKIKMGIHYCSLENKLTAQVYNHNMGVKLSGTEYFSEKDFFIKSVRGYGKDIDIIKEKLDNNNVSHYIYNSSSQFIEFSPIYIYLLKDYDMELGLNYLILDFDNMGNKVLREVAIDVINPKSFNIDDI